MFSSQVEYLFQKCKELSTAVLDEDYNQMMKDKAEADFNLLKISLIKSVNYLILY